MIISSYTETNQTDDHTDKIKAVWSKLDGDVAATAKKLKYECRQSNQVSLDVARVSQKACKEMIKGHPEENDLKRLLNHGTNGC